MKPKWRLIDKLMEFLVSSIGGFHLLAAPTECQGGRPRGAIGGCTFAGRTAVVQLNRNRSRCDCDVGNPVVYRGPDILSATRPVSLYGLRYARNRRQSVSES